MMPNTNDKNYSIENQFTYHPPKDDQNERYVILRNLAKDLALKMKELCPPSEELSHAIQRLNEASMWANAAIARHS